MNRRTCLAIMVIVLTSCTPAAKNVAIAVALTQTAFPITTPVYIVVTETQSPPRATTAPTPVPRIEPTDTLIPVQENTATLVPVTAIESIEPVTATSAVNSITAQTVIENMRKSDIEISAFCEDLIGDQVSWTMKIENVNSGRWKYPDSFTLVFPGYEDEWLGIWLMDLSSEVLTQYDIGDVIAVTASIHSCTWMEIALVDPVSIHLAN